MSTKAQIANYPKNLPGIQEYLRNLYSVNEYMSFEYIFGYVVRHCGYIAKQAFKQMFFDKNHKLSKDEFITAYSWLFAVANIKSINVNLSDEFLKKYPNICPHCLSIPCICHRTKKKPLKDIPAYKVREELEAQFSAHRPVDGGIESGLVFRVINEVYQNNIVEWTKSQPTSLLKLFEELAELHEAVAKFNKKERNIDSVAEEIADIFAWLTSIWIFLYEESSLEDAFWDFYMNECPRCRHFPCVCSKGSEKYYGLIDISLIRTIRLNLIQLEKISPSFQNGLGELIKSVDAAIEAQTESVTKKAIHQVNESLDAFGKKEVNTPQVSQLIESTLQITRDII